MRVCVLIPNIFRCSTIERPSIIQAACDEEASLVFPTVAAVTFCFQEMYSIDIPLHCHTAPRWVRASALVR